MKMKINLLIIISDLTKLILVLKFIFEMKQDVFLKYHSRFKNNNKLIIVYL